MEAILSSIVNFENSSDTKTRPKDSNVRRKLKLPAVMTSQGWIDLKEATEEQKRVRENEIKQRKIDRAERKKEKEQILEKQRADRVKKRKAPEKPTKKGQNEMQKKMVSKFQFQILVPTYLQTYLSNV